MKLFLDTNVFWSSYTKGTVLFVYIDNLSAQRNRPVVHFFYL